MQRIRRTLPALYVVGLSLVIVALARPQSGKSESRVSGEGIAIELVLDTSGSMEALDFKLGDEDVSRLEAFETRHQRIRTGIASERSSRSQR